MVHCTAISRSAPFNGVARRKRFYKRTQQLFCCRCQRKGRRFGDQCVKSHPSPIYCSIFRKISRVHPQPSLELDAVVRNTVAYAREFAKPLYRTWKRDDRFTHSAEIRRKIPEPRKPQTLSTLDEIHIELPAARMQVHQRARANIAHGGSPLRSRIRRHIPAPSPKTCALKRATHTLRIFWSANHSTQLHQRLIKARRVFRADESTQNTERLFSKLVCARIFFGKHPRAHTQHVSVPNGFSNAKNLRRDRRRRVRPHPGQRAPSFQRARETPTPLCDSRRRPVRTGGPRIISQTRPRRENLALVRGSQHIHRRKFFEKFIKIRQQRRHLGLLAHHFGEPNVVRLGILAPRKISVIDVVPTKKFFDFPPGQRGCLCVHATNVAH